MELEPGMKFQGTPFGVLVTKADGSTHMLMPDGCLVDFDLSTVDLTRYIQNEMYQNAAAHIGEQLFGPNPTSK